MAFHIDRLRDMARPRSEAAKERARFRKENREWLRLSQDIALNLHYYLRNADMTQKDLADALGVSPAYVGKLLKGGENLTLETICKLQRVVDVELISIPKPYVTSVVVNFADYLKFTDSPVVSEKFAEEFVSTDEYVLTDGTAA
ncbi:MAG: helix-turn-helix domain-containing protein [Duncaniella sp.]|nr:helix-turn-helix domain-containing protein [Duncaniella sp.]